MDFPAVHRTNIRTNNVIGRLNREIRRRPRVVGVLPDAHSARMPVCARLRHVAGAQWSCKKYVNMKHLTHYEDCAGLCFKINNGAKTRPAYPHSISAANEFAHNS